MKCDGKWNEEGEGISKRNLECTFEPVDEEIFQLDVGMHVLSTKDEIQ